MELTSLKLKTKDGKEVEVSLEEARELYNQLHNLFGTNYIPSTPLYLTRDHTHAPQYWLSDTICKSYGDTGIDITFKGK